MDIFQGLQIHPSKEDSLPKQGLSSLSDFDLLNISGDKNVKQTEIFDPLGMDLNKSANVQSTDNDIIGLEDGLFSPSLREQKSLQTSQSNTCKTSSMNIKEHNYQSDLMTTKTDKNKDFFDDLLDFKQTNTSMSPISENQTVLGFQGNHSVQTSQTGFGLAPTSSFMLNQSGHIPNQTGLTSHSGLVGSQTSVTGNSGLIGSHPGVHPGITNCQTGFVPVNPVLQNLLLTKTSQHSTVPLNLANPSTQKTDFEFLTKSKKDKAFSFVQDEMKASKK